MSEQQTDQAAGSSESPDELDHLRRLLLGPTYTAIDDLREEVARNDVNVDRVSDLLPDAIRKSATKDENFSRALGPTLSEAFEASIKRNPQKLADTLAPIMGPAIRSSIVQTIRSMVQSMNATIEQSFTPKGLRWRWEAWRTGQPLGEIVMLHTLIYRTDQVLLIDRRTGLLMQSVSATPTDDADLVSAMLTAIQDFMHDSFRGDSAESTTLQALSSSGMTLWIQHGPLALMAVAVRGEPPIAIRQRLQDELDRIHVLYRDKLEAFDGDTRLLEVARPHLEDCLTTKLIHDRDEPEESQAPQPLWIRRASWLVPTLGALALAVAGIVWSAHLQKLGQIREVLDMPPSVEISLQDATLKLTGSARHDWLVHARNRLDRLPEIERLDEAELLFLDEPWVRLQAALAAEPGIVVTSARRDGDRYHLEILRDELAAAVEPILISSGLDSSRVQVLERPYQCVDLSFSLRRLQNRLPPAPNARLQVSGDRLTVTGDASIDWQQQLMQIARHLDLADHIDLSGFETKTAAWQEFVQTLVAEPGIEVIEHSEVEGNFHIAGRADPLAVSPDSLLDPTRIDPARVVSRWESFTSNETEIVLQRAQQLLRPPSTVRLELMPDRTLRIQGESNHDWWKQTQQLKTIPGVQRIEWSELINMDVREYEETARQLQLIRIPFLPDEDVLQPVAALDLQQLFDHLQQLRAAAQRIDRPLRIRLFSVAGTRDTQITRQLLEGRNDRVSAFLVDKGIPQDIVTATPGKWAAGNQPKDYGQVVARIE